MKKLLTLPLLALALLSGCLEQRYEREAKKMSGEWEILRYYSLRTENGAPSAPETDQRNAGMLSLIRCESPINGGCSAIYESPDGKTWEGSYQTNPASQNADARLQLLIQADTLLLLTGSFAYAFDGDTLFLRQEARSTSGQTEYLHISELDLLRAE